MTHIWKKIGAMALIAILVLGGTLCLGTGEGEKTGPEVVADEGECRLTRSNPEGPYYIDGAPYKTDIAPKDAAGERVTITGNICTKDCTTPLGGAVVDIWQTDAAGEYDFTEEYRYRGRVQADEKGGYIFKTVLPGRYGSGPARRPAHIHIKIRHLQAKPLTTQIYFQGDPYLHADPLAAEDLAISLEETEEGLRGRFDIIMDTG